MCNKKSIIKDIELVLTNTKEGFYRKMLCTLVDFYSKMSSNVIVEDYYIDKKQHYISFGFQDEELSFELNINNQYLELRFFLIEVMFYEDDNYFNKVKKELLYNFFSGLYEVIHLFLNQNKIEKKELYWTDIILNKYNIIEETKTDLNYKVYKGRTFW